MFRFRRCLAALRSSASSGAGSLLRLSASGGAESLLRSSARGGARECRAGGGGLLLLRSMASGASATGGARVQGQWRAGGGGLLLLRSMASGASAIGASASGASAASASVASASEASASGASVSGASAHYGHKTLRAMLSLAISFSVIAILFKNKASASAEQEDEFKIEFVDWDKQEEDEEKDDLPEFVDWELEGAVNVPKNQGRCGSCWAHAVVGSIEAIHSIVWGELLDLSVQSVIDCATRLNRRGNPVIGCGCHGGRVVDAYVYAMRFGLTKEESYPLRTFLGHFICRSRGKPIHATINGWGRSDRSERKLMAAVAKQPVVVAVDHLPDDFQYNGGLIEEKDWPPEFKDVKKMHTHAVLVVGYGTDSLGRKYWKIKNSWGSKWGKNGFAYLRRGGSHAGVGGITRYEGTYPVIFNME